MEIILETNVCVSNLECDPQEDLLKMSITLLTVGVPGLSWKMLCFNYSGIWGCSANTISQLSEFQGIFKDSAPAHFRQEGHCGNELCTSFPTERLNQNHQYLTSIPSQYQQFLLAQVIRPTAPVSGESRSLFSWMYPAIRDIWSGKSSQTLCFSEIWNYLSWNETNLDNSIPTLHGKNALPKPTDLFMEQSLINLSALG